MKCLICKQKVAGLKAGVVNGKYISDRCEWCYSMETHGYDVSSMAVKFDRGKDIEDNKKDLIQPYHKGKPSREFIEAYPEQSKNYFNKEQLEKAERS
jgi:hypothetical protein